VTLTQGDFATEDRLELHRSVWVGSFEKARRGPQDSRRVRPGPRPSFSTLIHDGHCISGGAGVQPRVPCLMLLSRLLIGGCRAAVTRTATSAPSSRLPTPQLPHGRAPLPLALTSTSPRLHHKDEPSLP
jgi:hypothetical protein